MLQLKVIHIPFCYYPDAVGGTEIYVQALAQSLQAQSVECVIAAPTESENNSSYCHVGLKVRRFSTSSGASHSLLSELYGDGDPVAAQAFTHILDEEQPDFVHMHAFTRGCSLRLVRAAKARGIPVIFTYHTPTVSCPRGTLLRWGNEICDGFLETHRCTACTLNGLGLNKPLSIALGSLPASMGGIVASAGLSGGPWTALRMSQLLEMRGAAFEALMTEVNRVVVLCQWTKDLLIRNGISIDKISLCRHGVNQMTSTEFASSARRDLNISRRRRHQAIRIAFLGRLHPTKGVDLLIHALRAHPNFAAELHIYGVSQRGAGDEYLQVLRAFAEDDTRILFKAPIPTETVIPVLKEYDVVAVPSRWLETGPLVVLEAFAAGVPVLGSNLGGIAELVEHEINGLLVEPDSAEAWGQALQRCSDDGAVLERLRAGIPAPRRMETVAQETVILYEQARLNQH